MAACRWWCLFCDTPILLLWLLLWLMLPLPLLLFFLFCCRYVRLIQSSGAHLLTIINDILDFSKITTSGDFQLSPSAFNAAALAETALTMFLPQVRALSCRVRGGGFVVLWCMFSHNI